MYHSRRVRYRIVFVSFISNISCFFYQHYHFVRSNTHTYKYIAKLFFFLTKSLSLKIKSIVFKVVFQSTFMMIHLQYVFLFSYWLLYLKIEKSKYMCKNIISKMCICIICIYNKSADPKYF